MEKEQQIRDIVHLFFREYTERIALSETGMPPEQLQPKMLKQALLNHYEEVADAFHRAVYPQIAALNGLPDNPIPAEITPDTMRNVCVTTPLFDAMVDSYRHHFIALLNGTVL